AHDAMWVLGRDLSLTRFNRAFGRLCTKAFERTARRGVDAAELFDEEARDLCTDLFRRALAGRAVNADASFHLEGMSRSYVISAPPVMEGDAITGVAFTAHDVTEVARRAREDVFELSLTRLFFEGDKPLPATIASALSYVCQSDEWHGGVIWLV